MDNAASGDYGDLVEMGVDPTKVTRSALQNAASVAGLLTTDAMIADAPKDDSAAGGGAPDMGGMGGMGGMGMGGMPGMMQSTHHCVKLSSSFEELFLILQLNFSVTG